MTCPLGVPRTKVPSAVPPWPPGQAGVQRPRQGRRCGDSGPPCPHLLVGQVPAGGAGFGLPDGGAGIRRPRAGWPWGAGARPRGRPRRLRGPLATPTFSLALLRNACQHLRDLPSHLLQEASRSSPPGEWVLRTRPRPSPMSPERDAPPGRDTPARWQTRGQAQVRGKACGRRRCPPILWADQQRWSPASLRSPRKARGPVLRQGLGAPVLAARGGRAEPGSPLGPPPRSSGETLCHLGV